jgi:hypothetical protein
MTSAALKHDGCALGVKPATLSAKQAELTNVLSKISAIDVLVLEMYQSSLCCHVGDRVAFVFVQW